jgi:hypothetical protein
LVDVEFRLDWGGIGNDASGSGVESDEGRLKIVLVNIRVKVGIEGEGYCDSLFCGDNSWVVWHGNEAGVKWVDELGNVLWVVEVDEISDVKRAHHGVIFMNQVVAMEHVKTIPRSVASQDPDLLILSEKNDILERDRLVNLDTTVALLTGDNLEIDEMDVDGVSPSTTHVDKLPKLDRSTWGSGKNTVGNVVEGDTVDLPFTVPRRY